MKPCVVIFLLLCRCVICAESPGDSVWFSGTIVSVQQGNYVVRQSDTHKLTAVKIKDSVRMFGADHSTLAALKPGFRVFLRGGRVAGQFLPNYLQYSETTCYGVEGHFVGVQPGRNPDLLHAGGTLKSVTPFIFDDDAGETQQLSLKNLKVVYHGFNGSENDLFIGLNVEVGGRLLSDQCVAADILVLNADHPYARGAMFGKILGSDASSLLIQPAYATNSLRAIISAGLKSKRQIPIHPNSLMIGQQVTVWGIRQISVTGAGSNFVNGLGIFVGEELFPIDSTALGATMAEGIIDALKPEIVVRTMKNAETLHVHPIQSMPVARLVLARLDDVRINSEGMFVLKHRSDGGFEVSDVVLDAVPWSGYGD
jgi:hypothetical protein